MRPTKNRWPGVAPRTSGSDFNSSSSANVILLPRNANTGHSFDRLTARLVIDQYRAGTLPEGVIVALLANAGLHP
jgi:hypothetical protein